VRGKGRGLRGKSGSGQGGGENGRTHGGWTPV